MKRDLEYWQRALAAFKYAKLAANEADEAAWRRVAEGFLALYRQHQCNEEDPYAFCITEDAGLKESASLN